MHESSFVFGRPCFIRMELMQTPLRQKVQHVLEEQLLSTDGACRAVWL
jgi:hypothetical protein